MGRPRENHNRFALQGTLEVCRDNLHQGLKLGDLSDLLAEALSCSFQVQQLAA